MTLSGSQLRFPAFSGSCALDLKVNFRRLTESILISLHPLPSLPAQMETVSGAPVSDIAIDGPASLEHVGTCHLFSAAGPQLKHQDKDSV